MTEKTDKGDREKNMDKLIITAAVTGSVATRKENPNIPYSPEEIADEIVRSCEAGASITHIHVRDPKTGGPAFELDYFREIRDRIRSRSKILLNFTTSALNLKGDNIIEQRLGPTTLGPELCTLDVASLNLQNRIFINHPGVHAQNGGYRSFGVLRPAQQRLS
jgi:3-keto-5-aminohexanoate cleavage enzyme